MSYAVVCAVALLASALTLFSGFGLGTLLLPALAIFFEPAVAVAATAVVHLANNVFKGALLWKWPSWPVVLRFGAPAAVAALAGAALLAWMADSAALVTWRLGGRTHEITLVKLVVGGLIGVFALLEFGPLARRIVFGPRWLIAGGAVSGFFGGLSGHQGALRMAFLTKLGLTKEQLLGTAAMCAIVVDISRLGVYAAASAFAADTGGGAAAAPTPWRLIGAACLAAFIGSFVGARLVKRVTLDAVHAVIMVMLLLTSILMMAGVI